MAMLGHQTFFHDTNFSGWWQEAKNQGMTHLVCYAASTDSEWSIDTWYESVGIDANDPQQVYDALKPIFAKKSIEYLDNEKSFAAVFNTASVTFNQNLGGHGQEFKDSDVLPGNVLRVIERIKHEIKLEAQRKKRPFGSILKAG